MTTLDSLHVRTSPKKRPQTVPSLLPVHGSPRRAPKHLTHDSPPAADSRGCCNASLLRKGWFWGLIATFAAVVVIVVVIAVAITNGNVGGRRSSDSVVLEYPSNLGPRPALKLQGARLVQVQDGKEAEIHGVNWFGFNNGKTMVDGLDAEKQASWEGGDFVTIVHQLKLLGFNAVRLPFQFTDLLLKKPQSYDKPCPAMPPTAASLAARTTAPGASNSANKPVPDLPTVPPGSKPAVCNAYLPSGPNTLARYLWVVRYFVGEGFYVLVDYHSHENEAALQSPQSLAESWLQVWRGLTALPNWDSTMKGRVFLDVLNEPDEHKLGWNGPMPGSLHTASLSEYYFAAMDALYKESPDSTLFFIQGGGQSALGTSWGDGFVTDKTLIQQRSMSDANGFFTALLAKPYRNQVVLAPHLYGVSVTRSPDVNKVEWEKFEASWGKLQASGYCSATDQTNCQKFPVVAGEIGTNLENPLDVQYYNDMAAFFRKTPATDGYQSVKFNNWFWWAYNANSGDTGGLVGQDWQTLNWQKLKWLQDKMALTPWYM